MVCRMCGNKFIPSKNDLRIIFCSTKCRLEFRKANNYMKKYYSNNKSVWKQRQQTQEYKDSKNSARREKYATDATFRERHKNNVRIYNLRNPRTKFAQRLSVYGLTIDDYESLLKKQNYKCAICGSDNTKSKISNRFYVDHDHETGKIRGLLCSNCNFALGHFNDNIDILLKAISYLEENNG
jgi:hypothetical protein